MACQFNDGVRYPEASRKLQRTTKTASWGQVTIVHLRIGWSERTNHLCASAPIGSQPTNYGTARTINKIERICEDAYPIITHWLESVTCLSVQKGNTLEILLEWHKPGWAGAKSTISSCVSFISRLFCGYILCSDPTRQVLGIPCRHGFGHLRKHWQVTASLKSKR